MSDVRIVVAGASGRMGRALIRDHLRKPRTAFWPAPSKRMAIPISARMPEVLRDLSLAALC